MIDHGNQISLLDLVNPIVGIRLDGVIPVVDHAGVGQLKALRGLKVDSTPRKPRRLLQEFLELYPRSAHSTPPRT